MENECLNCGVELTGSKEIDHCEDCMRLERQTRSKVEKEILNKIKNISNPYPDDVFPSITKKELEKISDNFQFHFGISLDRFSAELMRRSRKVLLEDIQIIIQTSRGCSGSKGGSRSSSRDKAVLNPSLNLF